MTYTGVRREAIQGALITISLVLGLPVLRSRNPVETADLILYAARQVTFVARSGLKRYGYRPKGKRKRQLFILQGLPGIGRERANRLLDKFGSVEAIMNANCGELQMVDGIGNNTAKKIKWSIRESIPAYGFEEKFPV
jgi:ERCC4-type nuclease